MERTFNAVLISTYELGRQPFGLASPAAWLRRAGASVTCLDLSRERLREEPVRAADFIAFHVPMHTATRLAVEVLPVVQRLNPRAHLCFYGLYAPVNEAYLRSRGAQTILGGEFEAGLVSALARASEARSEVQPGPVISVARQAFVAPAREGLPPLESYARLRLPGGERRVTGYTEASRGCKHLCRHCPVVPVYNGRFRIVPRHVVLDDIRWQVAAGAQHITFGDPDFFNGPRHAIEIVSALHAEHPKVTYDVTIKIEHLLQHAGHLKTLRETGCLFVTSAVESVDESILTRLDKGHTYADFVAVVELICEVGLTLSPTFVAFTPWTTLEGYGELLARLVELDLIEQVAPIQLAIRLLIPAGSRLLELREVREMVEPFDPAALAYPWSNPDPRIEELARNVRKLVERAEKAGVPRSAIFRRIWRLAHETAGRPVRELGEAVPMLSRAAIPHLTEPWYC